MKFIYRENFPDIPFVKKAAMSAMEMNKHPKDIHTRMIEVYLELYHKLGEEIHLEYAYTHMSAFLRAGYDYRGHEAVLVKVAEAVGYESLEEFLHVIEYKINRVKLTKNRIESLLGNGNQDDNAKLRKSEMVEEIMQKIKDGEQGRTCYSQFYKNHFNVTYLTINEYGAYILDNNGDEYKFYID